MKLTMLVLSLSLAAFAQEPPAGPPPLPEKAPAESSQLVTERGPFGVCFVCGTPLEGRLCPTCRMSWVE